MLIMENFCATDFSESTIAKPFRVSIMEKELVRKRRRISIQVKGRASFYLRESISA